MLPKPMWIFLDSINKEFYMKTISFLFISFFFIFLMSCEEPNNSTNDGLNGIMLGPPPYLSLDDVLSSYDTSGVIGIIYLDDVYSSILSNSSVLTDHYCDGKAYFYDSLNNSVPCDSLVFNNYNFVKPISNQNFYAGEGNHISQSGMLINFGQLNHLKLVGAQYLTNADTNFYLNNSIAFSSISPGDTIDNDNDLTLQWNSTSNTYVQIEFKQIDSVLAGGQINNLTLSTIILANTGSYVIQDEYLSQMNPGEYITEIKRFEPIFINQGQNKKILALCTSKHKINVFIKD